MEPDSRQIDEWFLWLDENVFLRTIPAMIKGTGA
jgi:lipopolysaccharide/colanic/teichoic acid biosynthesis glycosyltransferase